MRALFRWVAEARAPVAVMSAPSDLAEEANAMPRLPSAAERRAQSLGVEAMPSDLVCDTSRPTAINPSASMRVARGSWTATESKEPPCRQEHVVDIHDKAAHGGRESFPDCIEAPDQDNPEFRGGKGGARRDAAARLQGTGEDSPNGDTPHDPVRGYGEPEEPDGEVKGDCFSGESSVRHPLKGFDEVNERCRRDGGQRGGQGRRKRGGGGRPV